MWPYMTTHYGNPSAIVHSFGRAAGSVVEHSRQTIARLLQASEEEIIFTSGATESINTALKSILPAASTGRHHVITCATEHSAVLEVCRELETRGCVVTILPVNHHGELDLNLLRTAIAKDTVMVAIMHANNETGIIHDIKSIGDICRDAGVVFFCDATQTVGKLPIDLQALNIDLLAFSGHKFYGPKGIGGLYINKKHTPFAVMPLLHGGGQEYGIRGGTLNVPGIVGMANALEFAVQDMVLHQEHMDSLVAAFEISLLELGDVVVNGQQMNRLPGVSSISFRCIEGPPLLSKLNELLSVSSGAACSSATGKPSHVLMAMGLGDQQAMATVRFSFGRFTSTDDFNKALRHVISSISQLREESMTWQLFKKGSLEAVSGWHHPAS